MYSAGELDKYGNNVVVYAQVSTNNAPPAILADQGRQRKPEVAQSISTTI
jgi:hypothetical protein